MSIIKDTRPVKSITESGGNYSVGGDVQAIIPYEECTETDCAVWFKIVSDGKVITRVNSKYVVEVCY